MGIRRALFVVPTKYKIYTYLSSIAPPAFFFSLKKKFIKSSVLGFYFLSLVDYVIDNKYLISIC
jgi:hypothetical protein